MRVVAISQARSAVALSFALALLSGLSCGYQFFGPLPSGPVCSAGNILPECNCGGYLDPHLCGSDGQWNDCLAGVGAACSGGSCCDPGFGLTSISTAGPVPYDAAPPTGHGFADCRPGPFGYSDTICCPWDAGGNSCPPQPLDPEAGACSSVFDCFGNQGNICCFVEGGATQCMPPSTCISGYQVCPSSSACARGQPVIWVLVGQSVPATMCPATSVATCLPGTVLQESTDSAFDDAEGGSLDAGNVD
jgi:hypothetical protein